MTTQTTTTNASAATTAHLEDAFLNFKKFDHPNIFADSIADLCAAEIRRIHACSNANDAASELSEVLEKPTPEKVFELDNENALERFADGSLYEKSSGDSTVWAFASDFHSCRIGYDEPITAGMREFFGEDAPEYPSAFRVTVRRFFYGSLAQEDWMNDERGDALEFATREEAEAAITEAESGTCYLSHNESGLPGYIITPI